MLQTFSLFLQVLLVNFTPSSIRNLLSTMLLWLLPSFTIVPKLKQQWDSFANLELDASTTTTSPTTFVDVLTDQILIFLWTVGDKYDDPPNWKSAGPTASRAIKADAMALFEIHFPSPTRNRLRWIPTTRRKTRTSILPSAKRRTIFQTKTFSRLYKLLRKRRRTARLQTRTTTSCQSLSKIYFVD
jgi:hypothetical protein